jgi:hypothetical protein
MPEESKIINLIQAIAEMEGFYRPDTIPSDLHNPGDLIFAGQPNSVPHTRGKHTFAHFQTEDDGWVALLRQVLKFAASDFTVARLIKAWAPPSENDTDRYLDFICKEVGCTPDTLVKSLIL